MVTTKSLHKANNKNSSPVKNGPRFSSAVATTMTGGKGGGWEQLRGPLIREVLGIPIQGTK